MIIFVGGGQGEGYWGHILPKTPKIALISECLAADSSPDSSPDASADALAIINIRNCTLLSYESGEEVASGVY